MSFNAFLTIGFPAKARDPKSGQLLLAGSTSGRHGTGDCTAGAARLTAAA